MANMAILTTNQRSVRVWGWMPNQLRWSSSEGKLFLLTSPFIELSGGGDFRVLMYKRGARFSGM